MGRRAGGLTAVVFMGGLVPLVALGGCGELFLEEGSPPPATPDPSADAGIPDPSADAATIEDASSPDAAEPCDEEHLTLKPAHDTHLSECAGTIHYGADDFANVRAPNFAAIVRFALRDEDVAVLSTKKIVSASLRVVSFPDCGNCGGGLPAGAGTLSVHPMRQDWTEAKPKNPDFCRRQNDVGWGAGGTAGGATRIAAGVDYDEVAATAAVAANDPYVVVPLTREHLVARDAIGQRSIAFFVQSSAQLIIATREKPGDEPTLDIAYCK